MRYAAVILFTIVLLTFILPGCSSTGETTSTTMATASSAISKSKFGGLNELTSDWRAISIMIVLITGVLVAIAYAFGKGFDMPEIRAWAANELVQIFATAMIIIGFGLILTFADMAVASTVNLSKPGFTCSALENCGLKAASNYLSGLVELSRSEISSLTADAVKRGYGSSVRLGIGCNMMLQPFPCLQIYGSFGLPTLVNWAMNLEADTALIQFQASILSILTAQQFFVENFCFKVAPIMLFIGIVARSFFVTRRLGGLLIAIAMGLLLVFPMMYIVNWISLNVTLFGDDALVGPSKCPLYCSASPPVFYLNERTGLGQGFTNQADLDTYLDSIHNKKSPTNTEVASLLNVSDGSLSSANYRGTVVYSCENAAYGYDPIGKKYIGYCSSVCREMPFPLSKDCTYQWSDSAGPMCNFVEFNQSILPADLCKTIYMNESDAKLACYKMPQQCIISRVTGDVASSDVNEKCPTYCRTQLPLSRSCSDDCLNWEKVPDYCRVAKVALVGAVPTEIPISARIDGKFNGKPLQEQDTLPEDCEDAAKYCKGSLNSPENSCIYYQPSADLYDLCSGCIFVDKQFQYTPAANADCGKLCGTNTPSLTTAQAAQAIKARMYGDDSIISVAALMIPAYILPLLNVVVTLMFIRSFSPILGGDFDIPGVSKLL